ncbi:MAG: anthrone oxygenase family protein [Gammaproteobacteria bacterium]
MSDLSILFLILAILGSGLMAGLFCSFSNFIMKALSTISAPEGIVAMQSINLIIVRPAFLVVFFGTGVASVAAVVMGWQEFGTGTRTWGIIGGAVYILGCLGVTVAINVPLNNKLAEVKPDSEEGARMWEIYLLRWTWWNHIRSLATMASTVFLIVAVFYVNGGA